MAHSPSVANADLPDRDTTVDLIVECLRCIEARYRAQIAALRHHALGPKSPAWTDYVTAVSKASMARMLAAIIERGDFRHPVD